MAEEVLGFDELLKALDADAHGDDAGGRGQQASPKVDHEEERQPERTYSLFIGLSAVESGIGAREQSEKSYQERGGLGELQPGVRLGRAPFKQRAAEAGPEPSTLRQAASILGGRRPKATAPRVARRGALEAAEPGEECPWRIASESTPSGPSRPSEELPGLRGVVKKRGRVRGSSKDKKGKGGDDPKPVPREHLLFPRRPTAAPSTDGELLCLLGGAPEDERRPTGDNAGEPLPAAIAPPMSAPPAEAEHLSVASPPGSALTNGAAHRLEEAAEDEGGSTGSADAADLQAAEMEVARLAALEELMSSPDLHEQGTFKIAGTWDNFQHNDMIAVGSNFVYFAPLLKGWESFQILYKGDWSRTLYPSVADGNPFDGHTVMGPDDRGHGKNWTIGRHAHDKGPPGTYYKVELLFDDPQEVMLVRWEPVGPEAAARRAREAVLQEAGLAGPSSQPAAASGASVALPPAMLRPLTGSWDGVPLNLGQAWDIDVAFTISVDLRAPTGHEEQGGRVLAKRKGRSGWELVAPRRENGQVSFYSSAGGHLNIGPTRVDDLEWHHVVVTYSQTGEMRSYIDGCLDGEVSHIVRPQPEAELWLGTRTEKSGQFLGDLRDLQVFDDALGAAEVVALYEAAVKGRED